MSEKVTMKGAPLTLNGKLIDKGAMLPDCRVVNEKLETIKLSSFKGAPFVLLTVPSLDTDVCSRETRHFNQEVSKLKSPLKVIVISMDLPFAQKRWCGAEGIKNVVAFSDYKFHDVANKFGLYIEELGLLARAVFIFDKDQKLQYKHLVNEVSQEPPYETVFQEIDNLFGVRQ